MTRALAPTPRRRAAGRGSRPSFSVSLALASALLLAPAAAAQDGGKEPPADPADPAAAAPAGPTEKDLLAEFTKAFKSKKPEERTAAITALGDASRTLPDNGTSKAVAKALAEGLSDEELEVRTAAVGQLAYGRHLETVFAAFKDMLQDQRKQIDKRITKPDPESKDYVGRGSRLYGEANRALANYRDDRSVETLSAEIKSLRPNTDGANLSTRLVGDLARALLSLGTADAVEITVKQAAVYSEDDGFQEPAQRAIHEALAEFSTAKGVAPPEFNQTYYVAWNDWFEANAKLFPKKLGKLEAPPASVAEGQDAMEPREKGQPAPR